MLGLIAESKHLPKVADFYHGKSVFVTGAAGFVGSVLLEILLRCCPTIGPIYVLLRSKKNVQPEFRKEQIFNKKIFERLKEENQEMLDKVHVIAGDTSLSNLGMSEDDLRLLAEDVSVVFHCAAVTNFRKPLKFALLNNVLSLNNVIELCRRMRRLEALVFTSTAYSNCNHTNFILKEEVHRLPFHSEKFLDALKNGDDEKLKELFLHCKPDWPNTYTFSKCLAENVIMDTASDLPIAIIRPPIVMSTWKHPIPGYEEENSARVSLLTGVGKGFIKVLFADPHAKLNLMPVDIVANTHVLAACSIGTKRCASPMIVNCTANEKFQPTISEYQGIMAELSVKFPFPLSVMEHANPIIVPNRYLYYIVAAYHHYLPAIVLDVVRKILGKKPIVYSSYRYFDTVMNSSIFVLFNTYVFETNNLDYLDKLIHPEDRKNLALEFRDATFLEISSKIPEVSIFYDWKTDKKSPSERQKIKYRSQMIANCIKGMFMMIFSLFICWIFSLFFL